MPFIAVVLAVLAGAVASPGQVASSPMQLVHPILKDPNHRNAPTSLNQDPSLLREMNQNPNSNPNRPAAAQPAQPAVIVARIDSGLAASRLSLIGTINGIKGTIYVTNVGAQEITPMVQMAVCDQKGYQLGVASKTGAVLAPNADERIVVVATNLNAAELKLMHLTTVGAK
jgi:predicted regulator of Ras-like GTPase activity (Roadblock/LC7/MglB family)